MRYNESNFQNASTEFFGAWGIRPGKSYRFIKYYTHHSDEQVLALKVPAAGHDKSSAWQVISGIRL